MSFPTTAILDDFNRANEGPPPSANWVSGYYTGYIGSYLLKVDTNEVAPNGAGGGGAIYNAVFGPDVEAYITATAIPAALNAFLLVWRLQDYTTYDNMYYAYIYNTPAPGVMAFDVNKLVGGVDTALYVNHAYADTVQVGDSFGISHIGDTISIYFKKAAGAWTLITTIVDNDIATAGYIGMEITNSAGIRADNFGGGDAAAAFTADFSGTPLSGPAPLTVAFTDATSDTPNSWAWTFGDGDISGFQNPTNVYPNPGTYTVALTASNGTDTDTETKVDYITVLGAPVVDFVGVPTSGYVALSVDFTDLSTNSPDTWFWDFGDGTSATTQNPTHVYNFIGVYTVTLTASSTAGSGFETKVDYITVLAISEYGAATVENCDVDTGGAAVGLRVADVAIARDNRFGSVVIDAASQLNIKDSAYSTLTNNGVLNPYAGDKSVWDTTGFPERHARDIDEATGLYHLINAATQAYTISNPSTDRAYNVAATTLNELAAVVGTLIADLQAKGLIS